MRILCARVTKSIPSRHRAFVATAFVVTGLVCAAICMGVPSDGSVGGGASLGAGTGVELSADSQNAASQDVQEESSEENATHAAAGGQTAQTPDEVPSGSDETVDEGGAESDGAASQRVDSQEASQLEPSGEVDILPDHPSAAEGADEDDQAGRALVAETDSYKVTLGYGDDAGIPDGASLEVVGLAEESDAYAVAREAVVDAKTAEDEAFEEESLELVALDISILGADGAEIEPTGEIQVAIEAKALPDGADGAALDVRHILDAVAPEDDEAEDPTPQAVAEAVDAEVTVKDGTARAEFGTDSFSVYVITWTRDSSSAQRVGNVRLHTVSEAGAEITDPDTYTTSELTRISGESGILTIADWIKTKNPTGFTYKEARLGSSEGTVITGLKVAETRTTSGSTTTTSYTLQYTSDVTVGSSSIWHDVRAAVSDMQVNNADIYLVFSEQQAQMVRPVSLHFMTLTGEAITDEAGDAVVEVIDAAEHASEYDLAQYAIENALEGYAFDTTQMNTNTSSRCQMILQDGTGTQRLGSSVRGSYYRYLRYQNGQVQMARGDKVWHNVTGSSIEVYVTFKPTLQLTIHHVDTEGVTVAPDDARTLIDTTTITPATDTTTVAGYTTLSTGYFGGATSADGGTAFVSFTFTRDVSNWANTYLETELGESIAAELQSELWVVHQKVPDGAPLTMHYVDADGNELRSSDSTTFTVNALSFADAWNGYTVSNQSAFNSTVPDGYSYQGDYLGSTFDEAHSVPSGYAIQYRFDTATNTWQTGIGSTATGTPAGDKTFSGYHTDIYRVYVKNSSTFTIHYVNETKQTLDGQADETFSIPLADGSTERELSSGELVRSISGKYFVGSYLGVADNSLTENTGYVTTDYQNVTKVRLGDDGKAYFLLHVSESPFTLDMTRANRWSYTTANGRTFTLRREVTGSGDSQSVRYSLVDDQIGSSAFDLNLASTSGTQETYTGSAASEKKSTVYTVTVTTTTSGSTTDTECKLDVSDWAQNDLTDIYQVYADLTSDVISNPKIEVKNDLVYSGHLIVQLEPELQQALENAGVAGTAGANISDVTYTWYKSVNDGDFQEVARQESGYTWNIARDPSQRTWLDLAADDGALGSGKTSVKYRCVLSYRLGGVTRTATSNDLAMINYDELENGSFEVPVMTTNQVSNSWYYSPQQGNGVWRTTGLGTGDKANRDIEIVRTSWSDNWWQSYNFASADAFKAKDGVQFAELNCEAAGALYQDVVTHPYENLNYWLSHRARGKVADSTPEYDTMYLVIMPTKLAMTSGANGGELKEQSELESYISAHGGFATQQATQLEDKVTYRDEDSGVLIVRISSNDQAWHDVNIPNGYTAAAGLTRFFFVAGPTASGSNTVGNFLDSVGFSQQLPEPESGTFQMVVSKTFSNLSASDIATLEDSFALTIASASGEGDAALNGARLSFDVASDGSFTLKANKGDTDLLSVGNGSNGTVTTDDDAGTVTMTWTLLDNTIASGQTDHYIVYETGQDVAGYACATSQSGTVQHFTNNNGSTTSITENIDATTHQADVSSGDVVRVNYTNSYNRSRQITVQKIFSGITPVTVQELSDAQNPYTLSVAQGNAQTSLDLVYNEQKPYSNETLPEGVQSVSLSFRQGSGGVSILTWTITGWDAGSYALTESGYHPAGEVSRYNTLARITVNGNAVQESSDKKAETTVTVGGDSPDVPSLTAGSGTTSTLPESDARSTASISATSDNLLIVQYENGDTRGYLVWTLEAASVNTRQAVLDFIKTTFGDSTASLDRMTFYDSTDPGTMQVNDATVTYDGEAGQLTFASSTNTRWTSYLATSYTLTRKGETVASDEPEIRLRNDYNPILKVQKIEEGHTDRLLAGATFRVYRYGMATDGSASATKEYYRNGGNTVTSAVFGTIDQAEDFTTDGTGVVVVGVLPEGTYYLEETHAPDGYLRLSDIQFHVSGEGVVTLGDGTVATSRTDNVEVTLTDPYYTITVSDPPGATLPDAGGSGGVAMSLAYLAGLAVVTLATGGAVLLGGRRDGRESS